MAGLTAKFLDSAKCTEGSRQEWTDTQELGLTFRVTRAGDKSWCLRYRLPDGSQRRLTLGRYPDLTLSAARTRALEERIKLAHGRDPSAEAAKARRDARQHRMTKPQNVDALWALYEPEKAEAKRTNTKTYQAWLYQKHVEPHLGDVRLKELDRATVRLALREIGKTAPVTANRVQTLLSAMLSWAVEEEFIAGNPVAGMDRLFAETSRSRTLTDPELKALWAALEAAPARDDLSVSRRMVLGLRLIALTATRGNEVAGLHASEIDVEARVWTIPAERFKGKRPHSVPLTPSVWAILEELFGELDARKWEGYAFPHAHSKLKPGEAMPRMSLTRAMQRVVVDAKFARMTPHDLRRTASTLMNSERIGALPHVVDAVLGHKAEGPAVGATYNRHRYDKEKRIALDAWAALLAEIVENKKRAGNVVRLRANDAS